jgi:hypothetical protein
VKRIAIVLLLYSTLKAAAGDSLVSMTYGHTMRIPHSSVQVVVDAKGALTVETESRGKDRKTSSVQLSSAEVKHLRERLEGLDWKKLSADQERGLDGTSVRMTFGKQTASLWSPDYNSKKRGLVAFQELAEMMFDFAGLDRTGLPETE